MASFTDNIPSFNPYISQIPVSDYRNAEMYKQGKYDQGVQQVQSYLDTTTGLNVAPKYKDYLQQSVNGLQDQVKKVAGSDFSDMQLVNQVGGAASKIVSDPIVQAGVQSQAAIDNGIKNMKQAQADGKSDPVNEWDFNTQVNNWSKDQDLSNPFTGSYIPHRDYQKKWMDAQEKLGAQGRTTDLPFLVDDQGRYIDKSGNLTDKPVLNDVMVEKEFKGKDPEKIKAAIMSVMDEGDIQQMNMDGRYHYRNYNPDQLKSSIDSVYGSTLDSLDKREKNLNLLKGLNPKNTDYQNSITDSIAEVQKSRQNTLLSKQNDYSLINSNPDAVKSKLYATQSINQFAQAYSGDQSEKIVENPYQKKLQTDREFSLNVNRFQEQQRHNKVDEGLAADKFKFEVAKDARDNAPGGNSSLLNAGSWDMGNDPNLAIPTTTTFLKEAQDQQTQISNSDDQFLKTYYSRDANGNPISLADGRKALALYQDSFLKGATDVPTAFRDYFTSMKPVKEELARKQAVLADIQKEADDKYAAATNAVNKTVSPIRMTDGTIFSPSTITSLALKLNKQQEENVNNQVYSGGDTPMIFPSQTNQQTFLDSLNPDERRLYDTYKTNTEVNRAVGNVARNVIPSLNKVLTEKSDYSNNELQARTGQNKPISYSINTTKAANTKFAQDKMGQVIGQIESVGGQTGSTEGHFDLKEARAINNDPEAKYNVVKMGSNVKIAMSGSKEPTNYLVMPTSKFDQLFNTQIEAPNQKVADVMNYTKGVSTNVQHPNIFVGPSIDPKAYETAYFSKSPNREIDDFPNVKNYTIKADIGRLPTGRITSTIYVKSPTGQWNAFEGSVGSDLDGTINALHSMGDNQIKQLLTQNK